MSTVALLLREGRAALTAAAIEQPRAEARILLQAATGLDRSALLTSDGRAVGADMEARYRTWIARRAHREPMAYILGSVEFWSLGFAVAPDVLVPRADSETLIEGAIATFPDPSRPLRLLDIGVGTGCLLLTLLHHYREASGVGTDRSPAALSCAAGNARRLAVADRLELVATSWASGVAGPFDLVVSNPPYIRSGEIAALQPEVACYEPRLALDGGADGLDAYRAILGGLPQLLAPEGIAILELGHNQLPDVTALAAHAGYTATAHSDLAGIPRCLILSPARTATA